MYKIVNLLHEDMKKGFIMATAALVLVGCGKKETTTAANDKAGERTEVVALTTLHPREIQREITLSSNLKLLFCI